MRRSARHPRHRRGPRLFRLKGCRGSASLTDHRHPTINRKGAVRADIPTIAAAGLWSAITMAALGIVAAEQSSLKSELESSASGPATSTVDAGDAALIVLTDATGNRYRKRRD